FPDDLFYVIDMLGVKANRSSKRYVARSYPLAGFDEVSAHLQVGRPVIAEMSIFEAWNREPALTTGMVDAVDLGDHVISSLGAILGFDPINSHYKVLTPWPHWGDGGLATLPSAVALKSMDGRKLRSIEAGPMPVPHSFTLKNGRPA